MANITKGTPGIVGTVLNVIGGGSSSVFPGAWTLAVGTGGGASYYTNDPNYASDHPIYQLKISGFSDVSLIIINHAGSGMLTGPDVEVSLPIDFVPGGESVLIMTDNAGLGQITTYRSTFIVVDAGGGTAPATPNAPTTTGPPDGPCMDGSVPLSWNAVAGADTYAVLRDGVPIASGIVAPSYTDDTAVIGVAYSYTVTASNTYGTSAVSPALLVTPCDSGGGPDPDHGCTEWTRSDGACTSTWTPSARPVTEWGSSGPCCSHEN